jgi:16S rRNA (guanine527-N7)-methyltransferase
METYKKLDTLSNGAFCDKMGVSRETSDKLTVYLEVLTKWQRRINLVGQGTMEDVWRRHFLDSAQLYNLIDNQGGRLLDLGSGAGFPGLVLSIMGVPGVTLLEASQKKCSFLREVVRQTSSDAKVFNGRIEDYAEKQKADYLTARALAPLQDLLALGYPLLTSKGKCLFLKGQSYEQELTLAEIRWIMELRVHPSKATNSITERGASGLKAPGVLLEIRKLSPRYG